MSLPSSRRTRVLGQDEPLRPSVQQYRLVVLRGPQPGQFVDLTSSSTTVGKGPDNDLSIPDATVSRQHFVIVRDGSNYTLRDLGSTNGTFLEETQIREAFLKPGARIKAGEVLMRFQPVAAAVELDEAPEETSTFGALVSRSPRNKEIFGLLRKVSPSDATILLIGETGTGKTATAKAIHESSARKSGPFVVVDCGAISKSLIESELFGHERGAFTGATQARKGAMEVCAGGTLFIDELDDLPLEVQPKLLRALDEREIYRVGSHKPIKLDLRVVAASKKDLRVEVREGRFREDLFFRISVVMVPMLPLRERLEDVPLLVEHFLGAPGAFEALRPEVQEKLRNHTYPGNLRELKNALERANYTGELDSIDPGTFRPERVEDGVFRAVIDYRKPFKEVKETLVGRFEREYLRQLLLRAEGNMARAARDAGIDRKYLYMLMKKYDLAPGEIPSDEG